MLGILFLACCESACDGGGGSEGTPPPTPPQPTPLIGTASATVVDDPSGTPLAGVPVRLDPWTAFATPGPTPTPIQTTTTDGNGRFQFTMPFGTYLLVIGDDTQHMPPPSFATPAPNATDTPIPGASGWRATIHDRIDFRGQRTLTAPSLVAQPFYTPPPVETHGAYRLATLDALTEAPCYLAYNGDRVTLGLPPAILDEWLTENVRALVAVAENPNAGGAQVTFLTSGTGHSANTGGSNCAHDTIGGANGPINFIGASQSLLPNATWFGGAFAIYADGAQASGFAQFPVDPRLSGDTAWP